MSDGERPKSSWQSWVRSSERVRSSANSGEPVLTGPGVDEPSIDADLDVVLAWGHADDDVADVGAVLPASESGSTAEDLDEEDEDELSLRVVNPSDVDASWTRWGDEHPLETDDGDGLKFDDEPDDREIDGAHLELDDEDDRAVAFAGDMDLDDDDDDDDQDFGELLPSVPLLPSIAGRVEALSGVLRAISHRVDGLSASTDVYRATMVDRIDQFTETVLEQGRHTDQSLDEYRRTTERTIAELRRRVGEQAESSKVLLGRVEEIATDLTSLLEAPPAAPAGPDLAEIREVVAGLIAESSAGPDLEQIREVVAGLVPDAAPGPDLDEIREVVAGLVPKQAPAPRLSEIRDVVTNVLAESAVGPDLTELRDVVAELLDGVVRTQTSLAQRIDGLQGLVEVVVDTMPGSAEGSAVDVAGAVGELRSAVSELTTRVARPPAAPPAPKIDVPALAAAFAEQVEIEAPPALDVDALADAVAAQIVVPAPPAVDVAALADAVVDRIDLDALAMLVAEHLSTSFEVVEEPVPPPPQTKKATPAKRASRRS